jgi:L-methionine (R)-S-oxide reductase
MSHEIPSIQWNDLSKTEKYQSLHLHWNALIDKDVDDIANLANAAALLKDVFGWWWVGFYRIMKEELVLGPFQGPVACTRIGKGKGVCGTSWLESRTIVVPNVDEFPGHIACSSQSKSEIVVPIYHQSGEVWGVLDVDSEYLNHFDQTDQIELEKFCRSLEIILS